MKIEKALQVQQLHTLQNIKRLICFWNWSPQLVEWQNKLEGCFPKKFVRLILSESHCTKKPIARRIPGNGLKTIMHCRKPERSRAAGPAQHSVELNPSLVQRIRARLGSVTYLSHSQRWSGWGRRSPHCSLRRWVFLQTGNSFCQWQKA